MKDLDKKRGIYKKYIVSRVNDAHGKHDDCEYFVLDPKHDSLARAALMTYANNAAVAGYDSLAEDIREMVRKYQ